EEIGHHARTGSADLAADRRGFAHVGQRVRFVAVERLKQQGRLRAHRVSSDVAYDFGQEFKVELVARFPWREIGQAVVVIEDRHADGAGGADRAAEIQEALDDVDANSAL